MDGYVLLLHYKEDPLRRHGAALSYDVHTPVGDASEGQGSKKGGPNGPPFPILVGSDPYLIFCTMALKASASA